MITYNQLIELLSNISSAHRIINTFNSGEVWEIEQELESNRNFVKLWAVPVSSTVNGNQITNRFHLLAFDLVEKGSSNNNDVLSDTQQCLYDVIKVLKNYSGNDFDVTGDPTLYPFKEEFGDWVAGWRCELDIVINFNPNGCDVPIDEFLIPQGGDGGTGIVTWLTCESLGDCATFSALEARVTEIEATYVNIARLLTINGTTYDLSEDRSWTISLAGAETDPVYVASSWYSTTNNSSNWNTAYGWGNHATQGYQTNPMTTLGDTIYGGTSGVQTRLAGNTTIIPKYLMQLGDGVNSSAPVWSEISGIGALTFMFSSVNSDISGYESMPSLPVYTVGALTTKSTAGVSTTPTLLIEFATDAGYPNTLKIPTGFIQAHYETRKLINAHSYYTYFEVYKRDGVTETLIATSDNSSQFAVNTTIQHTLTAAILSPVTLNNTDRIVIKIYGVMLSSTATIEVDYDDTTDARVTLPSITVDASNFVPYVGSTRATNLGAYGLTANSVNISAQTASRLAVFDGSKNVTSADTATYPSLTEIAFIKGLTSAVQTQLNNKIALTALSSSATGLTYTNTTGVFSITTGYVIPTTTEESNWNTAYGWGNHASAGYLTSLGTALVDADFTSNGIMVRTSAGVYGIITDNSTNWNTAYGWGNHASAGYLTTFTETDPVYVASSWYSTTNNSSNWNTAYGWGNHASAGYLTSYSETDPVYTASSWYSTTNNSSNWNTAYGWGNHASAGYLTSLGTALVDADFTSNGIMVRTAAGVYGIITDNSTTWNALVSNATHTGEVTGSTALTLDKTAISNRTAVTYDPASDYVLISDGSDSNNLKKALIPSGSSATAGVNVTVSGSDVSALSYTINPSQITAWTNDYAPTNFQTCSVINLDADSSWPFITGLSNTNISDGEIKVFQNDGSYPYGFKDNSTASTSGNRFDFGGTDYFLMPGKNIAFRYDSTNSCWRAWGGTYDIAERHYTQYYRNNFLQKTNDGIFNWWTSGAGASNTLNTLAAMQSGRAGVITSSTGTATGYAQIFGNDALDPNKAMTVASGITTFESMVYFDNLSDGTNTYTFKLGLQNVYSSSGGATNEVSILYSSAVSSGNWTLRTQASSSVTDVNSGIAVVADTWYHIKFVVYNGGKVDFWINGVYGGTSTTNIPTTTMGPIYSIWQTAGTTPRTVDGDYFMFNTINYTA